MNFALQKAIYTKLGSYAQTSAYTVVDAATQRDAAFPFVVLGSGVAVEVGTYERDLFEEIADISIFDDGDSGLTVKQMARNVIDAMRDSILDTTSDNVKTLSKPDVQNVVYAQGIDIDGKPYCRVDINFRFYYQLT